MQISAKMQGFMRLGVQEDKRRAALGKPPMDRDEIRFVARGIGLLKELDSINEALAKDSTEADQC